MPSISIATEAFNLDEGQSQEALRRTLSYLSTQARLLDAELLLAVTNPSHPVLAPIEAAYPRVRVVDCHDMGYDDAKVEAARFAKGEIIVFLDGDCVPVCGDWLECLVAPIRAGTSVFSGGLTIYEGGYLAKVRSILDFGFLYDLPDGAPMGCYAFNNFASLRTCLLENPPASSALRCNCYAHAQSLLARGTPVRLARRAIVEHELPPFFKKRWERGSDFVGERRENSRLPPARSSASILRSAWRIYRDNITLDRQRLRAADGLLGFSRAQSWIALVLFPILRLIDFVAVLAALRSEARP